MTELHSWVYQWVTVWIWINHSIYDYHFFFLWLSFFLLFSVFFSLNLLYQNLWYRTVKCTKAFRYYRSRQPKETKKIIIEPYNQIYWTSLFTLLNFLTINGLLIIVVIEKGDNLDSMQNRLKDSDEKNSILLKALNETFGKLSAIPNGKLEK